ncbi:hypothetical protein [Corallococcus sp. CA053C]|uniref:hypothetical protein n=1 Tax=Corallococcus sp. CA053C TaxID=2316732 RepID=UPI0011C47C8D|nr:hypothetical protein [Corallococcus sp. CA053C]
MNVTGTIKAGPLEQSSGGDFNVLVRQTELTAAMEKDEAELIVTFASGAPFASTAGPTFYRYFVAEGMEFQIKVIEQVNGAIRLIVTPIEEHNSATFP